jgi:hypothetical protein
MAGKVGNDYAYQRQKQHHDEDGLFQPEITGGDEEFFDVF